MRLKLDLKSDGRHDELDGYCKKVFCEALQEMVSYIEGLPKASDRPPRVRVRQEFAIYNEDNIHVGHGTIEAD